MLAFTNFLYTYLSQTDIYNAVCLLNNTHITDDAVQRWVLCGPDDLFPWLPHGWLIDTTTGPGYSCSAGKRPQPDQTPCITDARLVYHTSHHTSYITSYIIYHVDQTSHLNPIYNTSHHSSPISYIPYHASYNAYIIYHIMHHIYTVYHTAHNKSHRSYIIFYSISYITYFMCHIWDHTLTISHS